VRHRHDRDAHPGQPPELGREHPAGDHDRVGLDVTALGAHETLFDAGHARVREDPRAALAGALGEGEGELRGVEVAVGGEPGGAEHALGRHQREQLLGLVRGDQLEREAERLRPARLAAQLLHPFLARREPDAAALHPSAGLAEPPVELDGVHHHLRQVHRAS
jgi:hypothetical protein